MINHLLKLWCFHGWALLAACLLDWVLADPYGFPHPVRAMGHMISGLEEFLRRRFKGQLRLAGAMLVLIMCLFWFFVPVIIFTIIFGISAAAAGRQFAAVILFMSETFFCYQLLAAKGLYKESMKVCRHLKSQDLEGARAAVAMIVGRDTAVLDAAGITRAAVETVAENTSDGVIAPFLFMAALGPAGGAFYKAVNTMDSMVGYKNETYLDFGRTAAKLDDILNLFPARLTGILITVSAAICPWADGRQAWKIFKRDRKKHASPNSAHGEAACAGALHLRLAGDAWYFGQLHKKPYIGDDDRAITPEDIKKAGGLMFMAQGILMLGLTVLLLWLS